MVYTKEEFKRLWEANDVGSGITYDDIADCAKAWGISDYPRTRSIDEITYKVLKEAGVNDAEKYKPLEPADYERGYMEGRKSLEEKIYVELSKILPPC